MQCFDLARIARLKRQSATNRCIAFPLLSFFRQISASSGRFLERFEARKQLPFWWMYVCRAIRNRSGFWLAIKWGRSRRTPCKRMTRAYSVCELACLPSVFVDETYIVSIEIVLIRGEAGLWVGSDRLNIASYLLVCLCLVCGCCEVIRASVNTQNVKKCADEMYVIVSMAIERCFSQYCSCVND